jgi:translation initiation factor 2B subunit (eIF-2B alpha/beta/delta family)
MLTQGVNPQTEVISTSQLRAYILSGSSVATYVLPSILTIATLPTCTAALQGAIATVSNGTAYGTGTYGSAVSATGAVTRVVACTNTAGATTYAWAYN